MRLGWKFWCLVTPLATIAATGPSVTNAPPPAREGPEVVLERGYRVEVDRAPQVLNLDAPPSSGVAPPTLLAIPPIGEARGFVSAALLAQKAKQFDDGLYAAVEVAAEEGAGRFAGKRALFRSVCGALAGAGSGASEAVELLFGAARLGGLDLAPPNAFRAGVQRRVGEFLRDDLRSKPISFYTWSPELRAIFQQDRLLQTELEQRGSVDALLAALRRDPKARETYAGCVRLAERLTNPLAWDDLRPLLEGRPARGKVSFFPPSIAHETELVKQLYGDRPIPEGFDLADELAKRIRSGQLSLAPTARSGWYDRQTWALEPLVVPERQVEARKVVAGNEYRKVLLQLFKGAIALARETHIKQLEIPLVASARPPRERGRGEPIVVLPDLTVEPLPTHYLRRAQAYAFVRTVLVDAFGPDALASLHRLTANGPVAASLEAELAQMESLFRGAFAVSCRELGLPPAELAGGAVAAADAREFEAWAKALERDPDLAADARMMVPVFYDLQRRKTKVWVFLGWSLRDVEVSFRARPSVRVLDAGTGRVPGSRPRSRSGASTTRWFTPWPRKCM